MTYKTILVNLDPRARGAEHIGLAFQFAARFGAHLVGLYAPGPARIPSYALAEAGPALRQQDLVAFQPLGLDEQLVKRRVGQVCPRRAQHDLRVAGDLDFPGTHIVIGDR